MSSTDEPPRPTADTGSVAAQWAEAGLVSSHAIVPPTPATPAVPGSSLEADFAALGPYQIFERLGAGGMGTVYRARHTKLNKLVALKVIVEEGAEQAQELERFQREARILADLDHPGIVRVLDVGVAGQVHFIAMDLVEGGSLQHRMDQGPLPMQEGLRMMARIARAVGHVHARGYIHRDLKPANVLLDVDGTPRVADFGLGRALGDRNRLTQTHQVMGTPYYMAPEQFDRLARARLGPAADVFSLGVMLYEVLTSRLPFLADTPLALFRAIVDDDPPAPTAIHRDVPPVAERICLKAISKNPAHRYVDAAEMADDLERVLRFEPIQGMPEPWSSRLRRVWRRNRLVIATTGAVAMACVMSAMGWGWTVWRKTRELRRAHAQAEALESGGRLAEALEGYRALQRLDPTERRWGLAAAQIETRLEKARNLAEADRLVRAGQSVWELRDQVRGEWKTLSTEHQRLVAQTPEWTPLTAKRPLLAMANQLQELWLRASKLEGEALRAWHAALVFHPDHPQALRTLSEYYGQRWIEAGQRQDVAQVQFYWSLCLEFDRDGAWQARHCAPGRLSFDTEPTGADVYLFRYEPGIPSLPQPYRPAGLVLPGSTPERTGDAGSTLYPLPYGPENWVGITPLLDLALEPGSYLCLLRRAGRRDARYPVLLDGSRHWRARRDGRDEPVRLYSDAELGPGFRYVPAGPCIVGGDVGARGAAPRSTPWVDSFLIEELEVSVREYLAFLCDREFHQRDGLQDFNRVVDGRDHFLRLPRTGPDRFNLLWPFDRGVIEVRFPEDAAIHGVSWDDAMDFVRWKNMRAGLSPAGVLPGDPRTWPYRLPTDDEWGKAAGGVDGRVFVWGHGFDASLCLMERSAPPSEHVNLKNSPRGLRQGDESVYGVRDLAGGMREFCLGEDRADGLVVVRGGCYADPSADLVRCGVRFGPKRDRPNGVFGIRVVRSPYIVRTTSTAPTHPGPRGPTTPK